MLKTIEMQEEDEEEGETMQMVAQYQQLVAQFHLVQSVHFPIHVPSRQYIPAHVLVPETK